MKIGELFVRLGVESDTPKVRDFASALANIPLTAASAVTAMAGVSFGFFELTKHTLDLSNNLSMFRDETGLSIDELQRWQAVAKQVGISTDSVTQSIMGIANAQAQIRLGNGASMLPFGRLGIGNVLGKSPFQILEQIGQNYKRLNPNDARALMGQLGISPEMMRILSLSSGQFSHMASIGPSLGSADVAAMQDFQRELGRFNVIVEKSFVPALTAVEPYMADLAEVLADIIVLIGKGAGGLLSVLHVMRSKDPRINDWIRSPSNLSFEQWKRANPQVANVSVTQNIHSSADAEEVANITINGVVKHVTRAMTRTAQQLDNTGY